ncbi:flagellar biosynthesis anti-sigma factor FlgM [Shewanella sp. 125m-7]
MEINKINSTINTEMGTSRSKTHSFSQPQQPQTVVVKKPQAEVSDDCKLIAHNQPQLEQLPDVDQEKVAEIRQSLIDGSFEIDIAKMVDAMVQQHG